MEYMNVNEASSLWKMDKDNIEGLCEKGYIKGAVKDSALWMVPKDFKIPGTPKSTSDTFCQIEMTGYVSNPFLLNEEEKRLLLAELSYMEGDFEASRQRLNKVLSQASTESVKRGCYVTLALDAMALGDVYGFKKNYAALNYSDSKSVMENKVKELLMAKLHSNLYFSETQEWILNGEFDNLPLDAFCNARTIYVFNRIKNAETVDMSDFRFLLSESKAEGADVAVVFTAVLMASAYHYMGDIDKSMEMLRMVLDIAMPHHWIMPLVGLRKSIGVLLDQEIRDRSEEFYKEYVSLHKSFMENWNRIYEYYKGEYPTKDLNLREEEIMFYMINGKSNAEIADILCLSTETIKTNVKNIFLKTGVEKRSELKTYMEENS